eukprot:2061425-Amphidinium_carterae.2
MQGRSIAKRYVKRGFLVDFVALMVDVVDIVASTLTSRMASGSLQIFKVLRRVSQDITRRLLRETPLFEKKSE